MEDIYFGAALKVIMFLSYYIRSKIFNGSYKHHSASYLVIKKSISINKKIEKVFLREQHINKSVQYI